MGWVMRTNLRRWYSGQLLPTARFPFGSCTTRTSARGSSARKPRATTKDTKGHEGTYVGILSRPLFRAECSFSGFLLQGTGSPLRRMHQPRNPNTQHIQRHHRCSENAHVEDVSRGRKDGCDDEEDEDRVPEIGPHPAVRVTSH